MDATQQHEGERRVRELLIEPLMRRGLAKPSSLNAAAFEAMLREMAQKLAYMAPGNLMALEEVAAARPSGKDRDRFPICNDILTWAAQIEPPGDSASPLIRAVFGHAVGRAAIEEGWAPELRADLRQHRRWPSAFVVGQIRDKAREALRQAEDIRLRLGRGEDVEEQAKRWLFDRDRVTEKCREIGGMAEGDAA